MKFLTSVMIGVGLAWLNGWRRNRSIQPPDEAAVLRTRLSTAQAEIKRLQAQVRESQQLRQQLIAAETQVNQLQAQVAEKEDWPQKEREAEIEPPRVEVKPPPERPRQKDRLEEINGIGPVFARRLNEAGIYTFAELAELTPERVHDIVHTEEWQKIEPEAWISEARQRAQVPARP
jgi:predicted flap endonuclease-1-like 5' DNA nuclease